MTYSSRPLWREVQSRNFRQLTPLADYLELSGEQRSQLADPRSFPLNLPRRLAEKIEKGRLDDPILRQFVPLADEQLQTTGFSLQPLEEADYRQAPRLIHKYSGRVLMIPTSACAMHCRYCFRQNFDYAEGASSYEKELALIAEDTSLSEVILSGGDPLSLSDSTLGQLLQALCSIEHVKKIRFHSRFLIGIPERLDEAFLQLLKSCNKQIIFIIHCNHPSELDEDILESLKQLSYLGIPLLNQSVLLRGVNDDVETLATLCEKLSNTGVIPYYLHQLDRVQGAAHFEVSEEEGLKLVEALAQRLPGYSVPRYVREVPGARHKTPLTNRLK